MANFSDAPYNAVGDGVADDTSALQSALDNETDLIADPGVTFKVTSTLNIDTQSGQTIDWNGSTIINSILGDVVIDIDKRSSNGGTTYMQDLHIEGDYKAGRGLHCKSRVELTNVTGSNYGQSNSSGSPAHIYVQAYDDADAHGDWIFDGCSADGLLGYGDYCDYCDGIGAANAYLIVWKAIPSSSTTITFKNATVQNGYGPDGQNVGVFSGGLDMSGTVGSVVFDNITSYGFDRRGWKIFCGNITLKNCTLNDNPSSLGMTVCGTIGRTEAIANGCGTGGDSAIGNPNSSSGLVAAGRGSGATGGDFIRFESCTFNGYTGGPSEDKRLIFTDTTNSGFFNCTFNDIQIVFTNDIGDIEVCNSTFNGACSTDVYNKGLDYGQIYFDSGNTYNNPGGEGAFVAGMEHFSYTTAVALNCPAGAGNNVPIVTLVGNQQPILNVGDVYIDTGATANDIEDGDITGNIVTGGTYVNTNLPGDYTITYDVTDSGGLSATQKIRFIAIRTPQIGKYLRGGRAGVGKATVAYIGDNKLTG